MLRMKRFCAVSIIVLIATTDLQGAVQLDERQSAEETVRSYEHACEQFDFKRANSLLMPDARWIENSYPEAAGFTGQGWSKHWEEMKRAKVRLHYEIRDFDTRIRGDVAWITVSLDTVAEADTPEAIKINGNVREWLGTFVESYVLINDRGEWKIALGHASLVPAAANTTDE